MSKKIIIAEDSNVMQSVTKQILSHIDCDIFLVKNGQEVIDLLKESSFDLILLDIHMPVMDGMECASKIREMASDVSKIPIIAITGNVKNYNMEDFKRVGINDFITKPLNYDSLVKMVKKHISDVT